MTSLTIVPGLDVPEDGAARVIPGVPVSLDDQFQFQRGKEAFRDRVVPAVALVAHAGDDPVLGEQRAIVIAGVLDAAIRVMQQTRARTPSAQCHAERAQREIDVKRLAHRPADAAARGEIQHRGQVEPALPGRDVGNVADPDPIHLGHVELAIEESGRDPIHVLRIGGAHFPPRPRATDEADPSHETSDPLQTDAPSFIVEIAQHVRRAIGPVAPVMRRADVQDQPIVRDGPDTRPARAPHVEAGRRDLEHSTHESHGILALVASNAGVPHRDSLAKNAAAFFANSASCFSREFSRRSRRSSCSAVSPPREGAVASEATWPAHSRSWFGRSPNSRATRPIAAPAARRSCHNRTASALNSGVKARRIFRDLVIEHLRPQPRAG